MKKVVNVVAAIIENEEHEILCAATFTSDEPSKYVGVSRWQSRAGRRLFTLRLKEK